MLRVQLNGSEPPDYNMRNRLVLAIIPDVDGRVVASSVASAVHDLIVDQVH